MSGTIAGACVFDDVTNTSAKEEDFLFTNFLNGFAPTASGDHLLVFKHFKFWAFLSYWILDVLFVDTRFAAASEREIRTRACRCQATQQHQQLVILV